MNSMRERIWRAIAWRLPRRLAYWVAVRVSAEATSHFSPRPSYEVSIIDALTVWR